MIKLANCVMDKYRAYSRDRVMSEAEFKACIEIPMLDIGKAGSKIRKGNSRSSQRT